MANPWDSDPIVSATPAAAPDPTAPWASDPIVSPASGIAPQGGSGESVGRVAGLTGRALATGVADLPAAASSIAQIPNDQANAFTQMLGMDTTPKNAKGEAAPTPAADAPYSPQLSDFVHPDKWPQAAQFFADKAGLAAPQTAGERVYSKAVEATPAAVLTPEAPIAGALSAAAGGAASQATAEGGGTPLEQTAAGLAAGSVPALGAAAAGATVRGLVRGASGADMTAALKTAAETNTPLTVGQASGSKLIQTLEAASGKSWGGGPIAKVAAAQNVSTGSNVSKIVDNLNQSGAPLTAASTGTAINTGVAAAKQGMKKAEAAAYDARDALVPPSTPIKMDSTVARLNELAAPTPGAEATTGALVSPKIAALRDNLLTDTGANTSFDESSPTYYHGTRNSFDNFDPAKYQSGDLVGHYFSDTQQGALKWADVWSKGPGVPTAMPVKLNLQNPASFSDLQAAKRSLGADWTPTRLTAELQQKGFDGYHDPGNETVVFSPKQIGVIGQNGSIKTSGSGTIPYSAATALRTKVGQSIDWGFAPADPVTNGALKRVYGALTDDTNTGAASVSPEAATAAAQAKSLYASNIAKRGVLDGIVDKAGGPEAVYTAATSGAKAGATKIGAVMGALDPDSQNTVRATVLDRLGRLPPGAQNAGQFDTSRFLTGWNGMSPEAKSALFSGGSAPASLRTSLDSIASTATTIRNAKQLINPSGSGAAVVHAAGLMGLLGEVSTAALTGHVGLAVKSAAIGAGAVTANNIMARVLTNPRTAAWLARSTKLPMSAIPNAVNQLSNMAKQTNDPDAQDLSTYLYHQLHTQSAQASATAHAAGQTGAGQAHAQAALNYLQQSGKPLSDDQIAQTGITQ